METDLRQRNKREKEEVEVPHFVGHNCTYNKLDAIPQSQFSTKWGPAGFSESNHPLSIMVSVVKLKL